MKGAKGQTDLILIQFNNYGFYHKMQELNESKPFVPPEDQGITSLSQHTAQVRPTQARAQLGASASKWTLSFFKG